MVCQYARQVSLRACWQHQGGAHARKLFTERNSGMACEDTGVGSPRCQYRAYVLQGGGLEARVLDSVLRHLHKQSTQRESHQGVEDCDAKKGTCPPPAGGDRWQAPLSFSTFRSRARSRSAAKPPAPDWADCGLGQAHHFARPGFLSARFWRRFS